MPLTGAGRGLAAKGCRTLETGGSTEAVFGHFASRAAARAFIDDVAEPKGFKGLAIENDGCGDFEVEDDGVTQQQRPSFVLEAAQSDLQVSFEETRAALVPKRGFVDVLFGTAGSIAAAERLRARVAGVGFRYLDVAYGGPGVWRVLAPWLPVREEAAFRAEAQKAKLHVTFVRR